jgi:hypothetical protein
VTLSQEAFLGILKVEVEELSPEGRGLYETYSVPAFSQPAVRTNSVAIENVFVVARRGTQLLFYDDIEEEFGVDSLSGDGRLTLTGTIGPLVAALRFLNRPEGLVQ